ncbi:universal stress protein [Chitinophaga defluvii]|uniref:Universal stress protein n=1 Tax=Chitinophaga defluvii TaxID=3163343 RepID=A0ABV2TBK2_9BACT
MKTILLPTDFSDTAYHAAEYACMLTRQFGAKRLILFHAYQTLVSIADVPGAIPLNGDELRQNSEAELLKLYHLLKPLADSQTEISYLAEEAGVPLSFNAMAERLGVDLIVMGITGKSKIEQQLIGSNAIHVAKESNFPVIIVPPSAALENVQRIVFACDLKKIAGTTAIPRLKKVLDAFHAKVLVLNVDHKEKNFRPETAIELKELYEALEGYGAEFNYTDNADAATGIMEFARQEDASLIITIPKNYGFFEGLFRSSTTKKLAYQTNVPLLLLHEA